ncbi:MAG: lipopolysaccharide export system protein LptA [Rhodothermales bacterium]|jgi:lipopolysaccharide export system protein LptA
MNALLACRIAAVPSLWVALLSLSTTAQGPQIAEPQAPPASTEAPEGELLPTEITSDSMDYDIETRSAVFAGNVHVKDSRLDLKAAQMVVQFDEGNELETITCQGKVVISRDGHVATGEVATYDYKGGSISLSGSPILLQGASRISGAERIIFNRTEGKFRTEGGQPKIEFYSQKSTGLDIFGGSPADGGKKETAP